MQRSQLMRMLETLDCGVRFWLPMTDLEEDGVWLDDNTGELVLYTDWKKGEPNGGTNQNCGNVVPPGGWTDRPCRVDKASEQCKT